MRGGARPGSGRKNHILSDIMRRRLLSVIKTKEKLTGRQLFDRIVEIAFDEKDGKTAVLAAKLICDLLVVKESKRTTDLNITDRRVAVYLPEIAEPKRNYPSA